MATFVLVHPAWMGGWCWKKVAGALRGLGHEVSIPTLTGLGERAHLVTREIGLSTHVEDVANLMVSEDLRDVVLVGTSSGGTVITGVAEVVSQRVASLVYLDAFLPSDGQCTFDLLPSERRQVLENLVDAEGDGWLLPRFAPPPWSVIVREMWQVTDDADAEWMLARLRPTPARHFTDPVRITPSTMESPARTYVCCTRVPGTPFQHAATAVRAAPGWRFIELDTPHVPYITHPTEVVEVLAAVQ